MFFFDNNLLGPSSLETIGVPSKKVATPPPQPSAVETQSAYAQQLAEVPELSSYGTVFGSSTKPAQLTETETEYQVSCVKHLFSEHVVFQVCESLSICRVADLKSSLVQRLEYFARYCPGASIGHHAAIIRIRLD
jgi:hypothetical protein